MLERSALWRLQPLGRAAVELDAEKMVVLGQMAPGVELADLRAGLPVELVLGTLYEDDEHEYLVWQWQLSAATNHEEQG